MKKFTILLFLLLPLQITQAETKAAVENQISDYVTVHAPEQLSLLEQLVNINSGTANIAGVRKVGDVLRTQLQQLGFKTYWVAVPASMKRSATLVAERKGHKGMRLLLIGHLDTVFPENSPFQHYEQHGNTATGPGIIDDKGGDVVILYALKALQDIHALDDASITVILTGDEEDAGKPTTISRKALIAAAQQSDIALDFEWSFTADTATVARRGISNWALTTTGNEAHSSLIFQKQSGDGAIFELARILYRMHAELSNERYLSFNPGLILGGNAINYDQNNSQGTAYGKGNVIAKTAMAHGDLRFITAEQKMNVEKKIIVITSQHLPGTTADITFEDGIPAMPPANANLVLLQQYSDASSRLGYGTVKALDPGLRGAGDISHIADMVSAALAGLGSVGTGAHSVQETLDVPSLIMQTKRAALLINQLINVDRP